MKALIILHTESEGPATREMMSDWFDVSAIHDNILIT